MLVVLRRVIPPVSRTDPYMALVSRLNRPNKNEKIRLREFSVVGYVGEQEM